MSPQFQRYFLEELAEAWEAVGKWKKASNIKAIIDREKSVEQFRKLKLVLK